MASKKALNAKNLEALGAKRLAELLIELSTGNAASKRRLRLELAGTESPDAVAKEVRKRLTTIARSRSFVDWHNRRALVDDLETQRRAIVEQVAKADPAVALDLMWRFLALANSIFERCDDSSGTVIGLFHSACIAERRGPRHGFQRQSDLRRPGRHGLQRPLRLHLLSPAVPVQPHG